MGRMMYRLFLGALLVIGSALIAVGWLDVSGLIMKYFSYGGGLWYNPDTIARFNRLAPFLGAGLVGLGLIMHRFRQPLARFLERFIVPDAAWSNRPMLSLFVISVAGLFLEVVLIRWISVEIRIFAYFKNLALLACFFGFGLGAGLSRRRISYLFFLVPLFLLAALIQFDPFLGPLSLRRAAVLVAPQADLFYWGAFTRNSLLHALGYGLIGFTFFLVALPFIPVGQLVGRMLSASAPIRAYSVNILGSLVGLWLYAAVSFLWLPPVIWFGLPLLLTVWLVRHQRLGLIASLVGMALTIGSLLFSSQPGSVFWSPYQKLVLTSRTGTHGQFYHIDVNNTFYQTIENAQQRLELHNFPYYFADQPERVLIVGAGAGNDAASALAHGAKHVDAVDIDPVILKLGRRLHPEHPYQSERVTTILNDARAYFKRAKGPYDVIVYARLDSHTLLSGFTNVRLDHYVYTKESFAEARRLLAPNGVIVMSFVTTEPWLLNRFAQTMKAAFGEDPFYVQPYTLVIGSRQRITQALARYPELAQRSKYFVPPEGTRMITDDWPYLYLKEPKVPTLHLLMSLFVILTGFACLRATGIAVRTTQWHFFFLGAAFLLLEFQGVSRFALLFGTTWFVNTVVISAFLLMILAANWYVERRQIERLTPYYVGLLASVLLVLVPQQLLLGWSPLVRGVIAGCFQAAPVFFAGIIFATSFRKAADRPAAFASNLLGAVFGGLLESVSYVIGINGLSWMVMALYGLSWVSWQTKNLASEPAAVQRVEPDGMALVSESR